MNKEKNLINNLYIIKYIVMIFLYIYKFIEIKEQIYIYIIFFFEYRKIIGYI